MGCRYLRSLHPLETRIAIVCNNFSPHLTTKSCQRVGTWAAANSVEIAYTPTNSSWLHRIEAQFTTLRYFTLDGTDHATHKEQGSMISRYIIWRNRHGDDQRLRAVVERGLSDVRIWLVVGGDAGVSVRAGACGGGGGRIGRVRASVA
nr:hypothetical protein [Streptomyces hawaiiensis]